MMAAMPRVGRSDGSIRRNYNVGEVRAKMTNTFDQVEQDKLLAQLHTRVVWICHDVTPRAVTSKIKTVVQPQNWYIDLATVELA
jgi:hypothetical protein